MRKGLYYFFALCLISISCSKDEIESDWINVTVIGEGVDCRENWEIEFQDPPANALKRFKEIDLPLEYKVEDLKLQVKIRDITQKEARVCTTLGIAYPFKVVLETRRQ